MTTQALRPRSVGELVDATFTLYRKDAATYVMVGALAGAPGLLIKLIWLRDGGAQLTLAAALSGIVSMITYSLMTGVAIRVGSDVYLGGRADVQASIKDVLPKVGTLVAVAIMKGILFALWGLLFGVGMLYAGSRWFAPEAAVVLEGKTSSDAMARSTALSDGRKWHIFRSLLLGYGIYFLLMLGVLALVAIPGSALLNLLAETFFVVIGYPIIALLTMLLYYDARIRGEGFDVEHLAASMDRGAAP